MIIVVSTYTVLALILIALIYSERYWWGTADLIVSLALLHWIGFFDAVAAYQWCMTNPRELAGIALGYVLLAPFYALFRWQRYVSPIAKEYNERRGEFGRKHGVDPVTLYRDEPRPVEPSPPGITLTSEEDRAAFQTKHAQWVEERNAWERRQELCRLWRFGGEVEVIDGKPTVQARRHASRITGWMAYWPLSMIGWFIGDFLMDIWGTIYNLFAKLFQGVADRQF